MELWRAGRAAVNDQFGVVYVEKYFLPADPGIVTHRLFLRCDSCFAWLQVGQFPVLEVAIAAGWDTLSVLFLWALMMVMTTPTPQAARRLPGAHPNVAKTLKM
jgi:nitrate reductase NapE component